MLIALTLMLAPHLSLPPTPIAVDGSRWGRVGHRVVARVAAGRLTDRARREVRLLLGDSSLAEASTWADEVRGDRPTTAPWHYVNIPITDSVFRPAEHCRSGCVVSAAAAQLAILGDRRQSRTARSEALRWVVHLIGDLHQPLHAGDRGDRGGNDVVVWFQNRRTNLHALWDSRIIESRGMSEDQWVSLIERHLQRRRDLRDLAAGSIAEWTMQSHDRARDVVYPMLSPWYFITSGYAEAALPVLEEQMLRASVRLAEVLNAALD
jgi:hypothetical protein